MNSNALSNAQLAVTAASVSGNAGALYQIVADLLDEGVPLDTVLFDLLIPAENQVGARWQTGDYLIAEEHVATATLETVVSLLAGSFDQPATGAQVAVAAAEGDDHSLPGRVIAAHLLFLGYRTTFLGANLLSTDLREYLESERPDMMVLSCAMTNHLFGARSAIRGSHSAGVPVLAGGRGFGPSGEWARVLGADAWASSLRDVAETIESWSPNIRMSEAQARDPSEELLVAVDDRPAIVGAARSALLGRLPSGRDPRLAVELDLLTGAVLASELVGDELIIVDMLRWQRSTLSAQGYDSAAHLVGALEEALASMQPHLARRLATAAGLSEG